MSAGFGVAFDIDGVLVRGGVALPGAREALLRLRNCGIPHVFLTNNGGVMEEAKARQVGELLGVDIDPQLMVLSHTPMRDLVEQYGERRVLIMGSADVIDVARQYGFRKIVTVSDLLHHYPGLFAFKQYEHRVAPFHDVPIDAVITMHDPIDWGVELQVVVDVLIGGNPPGSGRPDGSQTPLFVSNDDFVFSASYSHPRFAQGAFTMCLRELYRARTGNELRLTRYGKPQQVAYRYAEKLLNQVARRNGLTEPPTIYGIGDNPHSDIQGANDAGAHWTSVLVHSGVHDAASEPAHVPDMRFDTVLDAVEHICQLHGL